MTIFDNIVKKIKKNKVAEVGPKLSADKLPEKEAFEFETKSQEELAAIKKSQEGQDVLSLENPIFDLRRIFWVFVEKKNRDADENVVSVDMDLAVISVEPEKGVAVDILKNTTYDLLDVTKGGLYYDNKQASSDMFVFSVKAKNRGFCNFRLIGSDEIYGLKDKDPIDSYHPESSITARLLEQSFPGTNFSSIIDGEGDRAVFKEDALISKKDVVRMKDIVLNTHKKERVSQIKERENFNNKLRQTMAWFVFFICEVMDTKSCLLFVFAWQNFVKYAILINSLKQF